ncbi:hypothetical protein D3C84_1054370 [compost metagenome]
MAVEDKDINAIGIIVYAYCWSVFACHFVLTQLMPNEIAPSSRNTMILYNELSPLRSIRIAFNATNTITIEPNHRNGR